MMVALFRPVAVDPSRKPCGDAVRPRAGTLEGTLRRAWLPGTPTARLQGALASLEDLTKGKRSEELDVIRAQLAQAQETLALSRIQLQRQQALFAKKTVPRASLDEARATFKRDQHG